MVDEMTKVWAAGAFDGEGSALISETQSGYQILVCVVNTDKRLIDVFVENWAHFDGNRAIHHGWRRTKLIVTPKEYYRSRGVKAGRDGYKLVFDYVDGEQLLKDIYPYLVTKREEADIVLRAILNLRFRLRPTMATILEPFYREYRNLVNSRI